MVPEMTAASLLPLMVIVTTCGGAVYGGHREGVGQRVADIERLHRAVGVVERVGPHASRRHREGAVAARARRRRANRREGVGRIVDVGVGERAGRGRRAGAALATPPASITEPVAVPEMMAASLVPLMVIVKV